jgi:thiosulfate dehydrogenase (quinone) large subunit
MNEHVVKTTKGNIITNPPIARFLFEDTRFAIVWLVVRVLLGLQWIDAASHKLSSAGWMETGEALKGYWTNAITANAAGKTPAAFDWYRNFLQGFLDAGAYTWFAKLIALGELTIGVALIIGAFVGIAAFFGAFMNWNFIMAGSASTNPVLFVAAIALVLAWKTAGYYGADRFLLSYLSTPWNRSAKKASNEQAVPSLA